MSFVQPKIYFNDKFGEMMQHAFGLAIHNLFKHELNTFRIFRTDEL